MTIRDIAQKNGTSVQAVYKRVKQAGINLADLKDGTGRITDEGAQKILELLKPAPEPPPAADSEDSTRLSTEVERLKIQVEKLTTEVELLRNERDNLRSALEREQALTGMALQRVALPAPEDSTRLKGGFNRLKTWFKKGGAADGN